MRQPQLGGVRSQKLPAVTLARSAAPSVVSWLGLDATYTPDELAIMAEIRRPVYVYAWGNNERRADLKGRRCVVEARGAKGTILVRFLDNGERVTTSHRAVRQVASPDLATLRFIHEWKALDPEAKLTEIPPRGESAGALDSPSTA